MERGGGRAGGGEKGYPKGKKGTRGRGYHKGERRAPEGEQGTIAIGGYQKERRAPE